MISGNTSDGSARPPRLRCYLNLMASRICRPIPWLLPRARWNRCSRPFSQAGYEGVQFTEAATAAQQAACARLGLGKAGSGRVNQPADAEPLAARSRDEGLECATLHVGWGMEDDDEADRLVDAVLTASVRHDVPLYVETHRATVFQDLWRSVQFVRRFPELRFNGDFSHWYTGLEMVYGGFEKKLAFVRPVLDRVRFLHGRIGNPGCDPGGRWRRRFAAHTRTWITSARCGALPFEASFSQPSQATMCSSFPSCSAPASTTPAF